jgi:protein-S-isoprenylcysteine O-methyltransferase Ste14
LFSEWTGIEPRSRLAIVHHEWLKAAVGQQSVLLLNLVSALIIAGAMLHRTNSPATAKNQGLIAAFLISLLTEMFGLPLVGYALSPLVSVPSIRENYLNEVGHGPVTIGMAIASVGLLLIAIGWVPLYRNPADLVTSSVCRYIRHPQYLGFILFTVGGGYTGRLSRHFCYGRVSWSLSL